MELNHIKDEQLEFLLYLYEKNPITTMIYGKHFELINNYLLKQNRIK